MLGFKENNEDIAPACSCPYIFALFPHLITNLSNVKKEDLWRKRVKYTNDCCIIILHFKTRSLILICDYFSCFLHVKYLWSVVLIIAWVWTWNIGSSLWGIKDEMMRNKRIYETLKARHCHIVLVPSVMQIVGLWLARERKDSVSKN